MDQVVREFGELVEDDIPLIARKLRAFVVDLLDVALGARRANDIVGIANPLFQPFETLSAHSGRQHGNAPATEDAGDRDPAAAVVSRGWPNGTVVLGIKLAGDQ